MYIMKSRFLTILAIMSPLLNIHYNNVDTPTKCTIVDKRTSEAGPFAVIFLESHKKTNTCLFSRKIFLRTITRLHARSFASCVHACITCIRTHVNTLTHRSDDRISRIVAEDWAYSEIARTSHLRRVSSDETWTQNRARFDL